MEKNQKDLDDFWHGKLTLKVIESQIQKNFLNWFLSFSPPLRSKVICNVFLLGAKLVKANVIKVKQEDKEVFEALACDSFAVK